MKKFRIFPHVCFTDLSLIESSFPRLTSFLRLGAYFILRTEDDQKLTVDYIFDLFSDIQRIFAGMLDLKVMDKVLVRLFTFF